MTLGIRQLEPHDADELFRLRRRALVEEPFAFLASPEDDLASSPEAVRRQLSSSAEGSVVFGALSGHRLIGMLGLSREVPVKAAHRAWIWGVFVDRGFRRGGVASRLLASALEYARELPGVERICLSVSEKTPGARRLYESHGFVTWGLEPDCMRVDGESAREYHMTQSLGRESS